MARYKTIRLKYEDASFDFPANLVEDEWYNDWIHDSSPLIYEEDGDTLILTMVTFYYSAMHGEVFPVEDSTGKYPVTVDNLDARLFMMTDSYGAAKEDELNDIL